MVSTRYLTLIVWLVFFMTLSGCAAQEKTIPETPAVTPLYHNDEITVGAERLDAYLSRLEGKNVGMVINQTSVVSGTHLADTLLSLGINIAAIFGPEHGFRGKADAGATITDGIDTKTGIPVISLYGPYAMDKRPSKTQLKGIDILLFDIQDVGARFYTYTSTMHYIMEAAAEQDIPMVVLDRPNPNGHYVDGPVLDTSYRSFVGMHPVPIVHGMTIGEYAKMINGEGWLRNKGNCDLTVIECSGYDHKKFYQLPIKPSPNLPNMHSIYLYPALCLFEGTNISVGRGTTKQFQILGAPDLHLDGEGAFSFTPVPMSGASSPKHQGSECQGVDFSGMDIKELRSSNLAPAIYTEIYNAYSDREHFFIKYFTRLSGGTELQKALEAEASAAEIERIYSKGIEAFKSIRSQYLLYMDFE